MSRRVRWPEHGALIVWTHAQTFNVSAQFRAFLWEREGGRCHYCRTLSTYLNRLTVDHKTPICLAGATTAENCVAACDVCNCAKGARLYEDFMGLGAEAVTSARIVAMANVAQRCAEYARQRARFRYMGDRRVARELGWIA